MTQQTTTDPHVTVREAVARRAACCRRPLHSGEVLELVGLAAHTAQPVATLSVGELRRLDLALALVGRPEVLLLDQSTAGLDPAARDRAWPVLRQLADAGTAVVLTTRSPREAESLADHVLVLSRGAVVADGDPRRLAQQQNGAVLRFRLPDQMYGAVLPVPAVRRAGHCEARSMHPTRDVATLCAWALDRHFELPAVEIVQPSFRDAYRALVGQIGDDYRAR